MAIIITGTDSRWYCLLETIDQVDWQLKCENDKRFEDQQMFCLKIEDPSIITSLVLTVQKNRTTYSFLTLVKKNNFSINFF